MPSSDQEYLLNSQYRDASNLNARIELHRRFSTNKYSFNRWVVDHFNIPRPARILEAGCGPGHLWAQNADRLPEDWDITLSDFSPGMLQEAQKNLRNRNGHFTFELFDVQSIPFEDRHFDAVIANHMLYHVPDRARALSEIRRVLKPGGRFYAVTNGENHMREMPELVKKFDPGAEDTQGIAFSLPFRLENGGQELAQWFSTVTLHLYEDGLIVTEAGPLVAYMLSMPTGVVTIGDKVPEFTRFLEGELAAHGAIHITKDTGIFEAF